MAPRVQQLMAHSALRSRLCASAGTTRFRCTLKTTAETLSSTSADESKRPAASNGSKKGNPWRHFQAFDGMDEYVETTLLHYDNNSKREDNSSGQDEENKGKDT